MSLKNRIIIAFAALYIVWGSTYLAIRFTIETLPPLLTAGIRFLIAGSILYAFARLKTREPKPQKVHWRSAAIIGGLLILGGNGNVVWAERYVPSGLAALIIATTPFWMVLIQWAWHKGKKPTAGVFAGIAVGFLGVGLLILPGFMSVNLYKIHLGGALALLMATLLWSIGSVYSRKAPLPKSPFLATGMEMICGGAMLILFGLMSGEISLIHPEYFSLKSIAAFIYLIIFGSLVGFTSYIWLLKHVGITKTSTYAFVNPVVAVLLGCLFAGEKLNAQIVLASMCIIVAVVVITIYHKEPAPIGE